MFHVPAHKNVSAPAAALPRVFDVVIVSRDPASGQVCSSVEEFSSEREARSFCREEVKWESCQSVECKALGISERGSFAR